ncbi:unnamed protein product [Gongylonema pulchrum]|uniref:Uncharacterized protein n=1 Tax=Gongylonema pulchrum TaxID=637853 RepID=A0A183DY06_9BILA|nr:unnamed protein product [Gongylonema pulchrum]
MLSDYIYNKLYQNVQGVDDAFELQAEQTSGTLFGSLRQNSEGSSHCALRTQYSGDEGYEFLDKKIIFKTILMAYFLNEGRFCDRRFFMCYALNHSFNKPLNFLRSLSFFCSLPTLRAGFANCVTDPLGRLLLDCHAQTECTNSSPQMRKGAAAATVFVKDDERMFHVKDDPVSYGRSKLASYEDSKEESAIVFEKPLATTSHSDTFNVVGLVHDAITLARILKQNKEKAILCLVLSVLAGLTLLLIACTVLECCWRRKKQKLSRKASNELSAGAGKSTELSTLMESSQATSADMPQRCTINFPNFEGRYITMLNTVIPCDLATARKVQKRMITPARLVHSSLVFLDSDSRICFDVGDLSRNKESFLRFTQLTPPRVPQNVHCYS